jgi:2-polyprenyl-3-methyl-5-hydroxy-6-metoxy-1,4-benzoquinol methylase
LFEAITAATPAFQTRHDFVSLCGVPINARRVVDEIMDSPDVDPSEHAQALAGLRRINIASKAAAHIARPLIQFARRENLDRLSMLDVACGGGDVSAGIAKTAADAGVTIDLTLLDRSETALKLASTAATRAGIAANTVQADLLNGWSADTFDVVTCSLFLHHIRQGDDVVDLLARVRSVARRMVIISDLRRCQPGLVAAWIGSRVMSRSPIVHFDAPASVRAAWTQDELKQFALRAGMKSARVDRCWPWRLLLIWEARENA